MASAETRTPRLPGLGHGPDGSPDAQVGDMDARADGSRPGRMSRATMTSSAAAGMPVQAEAAGGRALVHDAARGEAPVLAVVDDERRPGPATVSRARRMMSGRSGCTARRRRRRRRRPGPGRPYR